MTMMNHTYKTKLLGKSHVIRLFVVRIESLQYGKICSLTGGQTDGYGQDVFVLVVFDDGGDMLLPFQVVS